MTATHRIDLTWEERILGMLQGHLLGDAWGSGYEFGSAVPSTAPLPFLTGVFGHPKGTGTDDTAVMRATAGTIIYLEGSFRTEVYVDRLIRWQRTGPLDIGAQTSKAIRAWRATDEGPAPDTRAQGNGALMGSCPLAVLGTVGEDRARDLAMATHPSEQNASTVADYVELLANILQDDDHPDLAYVTALEAQPAGRGGGTWKPAARDIGWVVGCEWLARAALQRACTTDASPVDALEWVIRQGGDTDTNGAVAGALLGAWFGPWPADILANLDDQELAINVQLADDLARYGDRPTNH